MSALSSLSYFYSLVSSHAHHFIIKEIDNPEPGDQFHSIGLSLPHASFEIPLSKELQFHTNKGTFSRFCLVWQQRNNKLKKLLVLKKRAMIELAKKKQRVVEQTRLVGTVFGMLKVSTRGTGMLADCL